MLLEQLPRHVRHDGTYFEQSVHYHRYTIDFYTHLWLLDEANGGTLRVEMAPPLEALLEHVQCLTRGDGTVPLLGDEDGGGSSFWTTARSMTCGEPWLLAPFCSSVRLRFCRREPTAELVWLVGPHAYTASTR